MIFYFFPILTGFLLSFYDFRLNTFRIKDSFLKNIFLILTAFIFCGGYMTGSDWAKYELLYNEAAFSNFKYYYQEPGFYILMIIFKNIGFGFFPFMITFKLAFFFTMASFLRKKVSSFFVAFTIFLSTHALFLLVDNPLRFMIALSIIIYSYKYLLDRRILFFSVTILVASTIHVSSLIMFAIYFIPDFNKPKYTIIIPYFILFFVLSPALMGVLFSSVFPQSLLLINTYFERMQQMSYNPFTIGKIVHAFLLLIVVFNREIIIKEIDQGKKVYALTIAFFFLDLFGYVVPTFFRLKLFVAPFFYISLATLIFSHIKYKIYLRIFLLSYLLLATIQNIYSSYIYVPYTNYFISLFQEELPYSYRVKHNKEKYFEKTGEWPEYFGEF